ncbi:hypothetical protein CGRA01v4_04690 [Colletotrichum graminicola]|uniref:Alternative oxidase n=1 Tax=Colletotrichum graminicola (strain M1.001 / M2 / FGSC 10212) TaxID=645133 RepID=E3QLF1_COLGM|nr:uncharacterized protein GLRG_06664 [Colletotrichum graminicola M1.001]EFQ31689.1 hypothetical protein GLRG_06664 [Colletotrichum graminicola M1.001]WDK13409.1 hypothetical protein CGRA01v4_04690 [Colletotrichum graminicola]
MGVSTRYSTRRPGSHYVTAAAILLIIIQALWIRAENVDPSLQVQITPWVPSSQGDDYFDYPPLDSLEVRSVCNGQKWDSNTNTEVVFTCDNSVGEIIDIRNSILNCIRYAILAGGSLVMPRITVLKGSGTRTDKQTGERKHMGYMFDADHFIKSLRLSCPQLRLYDDVEEVYKALGPPRTWSLGLFPESLIDEEKIPSIGIQHPNRWRGQLYDWLGQVHTDVSPTGRPSYGPFIVDLGRSYLTFPIYNDGEPFAQAFGDILKFRSDARELATKALLQMAKISGSKLTQPEGDAAPSKPGTYAGTIPEHAYLGIYLQEGKDSEETRTPFAEAKRTADYLQQAVNAGLSLVYIANGDATQVKTFKSEAKAKSITVVTKQDLLGNKDGLENLQGDQQALVDFLVLLSASHFSGAACSSFSWNVALKRHLLVQGPERKHWDGPQTFNSRLNHLHGEPESCPEFFACLWP